MCFRISARDSTQPTAASPLPNIFAGTGVFAACIDTGTGLSLFPAHICAGTDWAHPVSAVCAGAGSSSPTSVPGPDRFLPTTAPGINRHCALLRREWTHPIPHLRSTAGLTRLPTGPRSSPCLGRSTSAAGLAGLTPRTAAPGDLSCRLERANDVGAICSGTPRLGPPRPHRHQDWARPAHIGTRTGLIPSTSAPALGSPCPSSSNATGLDRHMIVLGLVPPPPAPPRRSACSKAIRCAFPLRCARSRLGVSHSGAFPLGPFPTPVHSRLGASHLGLIPAQAPRSSEHSRLGRFPLSLIPAGPVAHALACRGHRTTARPVGSPRCLFGADFQRPNYPSGHAAS